MVGGETAQPLADYYVQEWKDIGLNVELSTGRLIDFQAFYDKLKNDDPEIDVFQGAWGTVWIHHQQAYTVVIQPLTTLVSQMRKTMSY